MSNVRAGLVAAFVAASTLVGIAPARAGTSTDPGGSATGCPATAFVVNQIAGSVSTIDIATRTTNPTDITVGDGPIAGAVTPDGKTAWVTSIGAVVTIDIATRTKNPTDISVDDPRAVAITPDGKTAYVTNNSGDSVSTIDIATRTKNPIDISVGDSPTDVAVTPDGKTAYVTNNSSDSVSTIDIATRTKNPTDITGFSRPTGVAVTPDGKTAYVVNYNSGTVSTIDVATRTKNPTDITGFSFPYGIAITPDGTTAFVTNQSTGSVSTIDIATRTKNPTDITVGATPVGVAFTPDGTTAYVANLDSDSVSTIDVATRTKNPTDISVGNGPTDVAITPCVALTATVGSDGRTVTVAGSAFAPATQLDATIASTPTDLGTVTVAADGTFSQDFTPPCTVGAGTHTVTVTAPSGQSASAPVTLNQCGATVRFAPNGGTGTMADQVSVVPAALTANAFTRPGYTFEAWNTAPDGTGTTYADGATYDFAHAGDTTLSAQWGVSQTITFGPLTNRTMLQSPFTVGATASSGLPVTFTAAPASVCTVSGTTVTLKGAGTCTITARQAGNATYAPAPNVSRPFTVSRVAQTITFGPLTNRTMLQSPFFVNATTSSALAGVFTATPASVCTINWTTVTLHGPGTCTITARQGGNATYLPAPPVSRSFTVSKAAQTITFAPLPNRTRAQSPFTVNATTSSGLPRTFSASPTSVCTVSGATVTLKAKGTCTITASQPGNAIYKAAPSVIRSFIVG